ncbi:protein kinase domain-containing protein [Aquisphaera insulae]|uniref:protein kinase domain-containing protein n=1 Tax=Aquisphaera insulae TaxID=2712864 RepID=UPI0013EB479F|nr:protein kinase [Aquisphaera insulae]
MARAKSIFLEAVERCEPHEWPRFLDDACGDDGALRAQVESLLDSHKLPAGLLDVLGRTWGDTPPLPAPADTPAALGSMIGPYRLREVIGEGGMGVVYMAEQQSPVRRMVALKVIKPGLDTRRVIARFEAERQALALMDHPGIARVLDAGTTELGRPYFVMELVRGVPITEYCDRHNLPVRDRLELFERVCRAVQHAHQKGIIHRDLKPTNVLIATTDGVPEPKVIDFGIAKAMGDQALTDKTLFTGFVQVMGTPAYMSPEQAEWSGPDVDTRSDVYSLGVLLYELLTGTAPFEPATLRSAGFDEVRRILREDDPPTPSRRLQTLGRSTSGQDSQLAAIAARRDADPRKLCRSIRGDLDWAVMKALEKDRRSRYESASAFASDIRHYLESRPLAAGPPSIWYRSRKFARRHHAALVGVTVLLMLLSLAAASLWQASRTRRAEELLTRKQDEVIRRRDRQVRLVQYAADIRRAAFLSRSGQTVMARELLDRLTAASGEEDLRGFEWYYLRNLLDAGIASWIAHGGRDVYHVEYSPDGKSIATAGADGRVRIWDAETHELRRVLHAHEGDTNDVRFSPEGRRLVTTGDDMVIRVWDAQSGRRLGIIANHLGEEVGAAFTPDGRHIIGMNRDSLLVRRNAADPSVSEGCWSQFQKTLVAESMAISPDGKILAQSARLKGSVVAGRVMLYDLTDPGMRFSRAIEVNGQGLCLAFSPDGRMLAVTGSDHTHALIYDTTTWQVIETLEGPGKRANTLSFSPDGKTLAIDFSQAVQLWDLPSHGSRELLHGHTDRIWSVTFSPDGHRLASSSSDGTVRIWDTQRRMNYPVFRWQGQGNLGSCSSIVFSENGSRILVSTSAGAVMAWDPITGSSNVLRRKLNPSSYLRSFLAPHGLHLAISCREKAEDRACQQLAIHDMTGERSPFVSDKGMVELARWSPDGSRIAAFDQSCRVHIWDLAGHEIAATNFGGEQPYGAVAFTALDEVISVRNSLASTTGPAQLVTWNITKGQLTRTDFATFPRDYSDTLLVSPDGRMIASAEHAMVWDYPSLELRFHLIGHRGLIEDLVFSPDGRTIATASRDHTVRLWNAESGQELLTLEGHSGPVNFLDFSPDGRTLASCGNGPEGDVEVIAWHAGPRPRGDPSARHETTSP